MIFTPVTAGLYSLKSLGRMGVAWISIVTRTIELLARILEPESSVQSDLERPVGRRRTLDANGVVPETSPTTQKIELTRTYSAPDLRDRVYRSQTVPLQPDVDRPLVRTRTTIPPQSPTEQLQTSPIKSIINIGTKLVANREKLRQSSVSTQIDIQQELPHRMHTRAVIAGAVAIHVPKKFERLLRYRNWEQLGPESFREISTEYCRIPKSDPAFEEFFQYILPPTALLLDPALRIYPEATFREAASGLLQLGFGLYQLVSSDGHFSVARDGLASPFLIVLPYLGMAAVNTVINILDPAYTVVTVLDVSHAARQKCIHKRESEVFLSPISSSTEYFGRRDTLSDRFFPLTLPNRGQPNTSKGEKLSELRVNTTLQGEKPNSPPLVQSPTSVRQPSLLSPNGQGTWPEFIEWLQFAYDKRIDVNPVDRLYKTPWISHSIIIGEFIYTTFVGLLIPLVTLAVVGGWTHFRTSNFGPSLIFNLLTLFGVPFIQFVLYTHHLFFRVRRDLRGRKEHGTFYWEPGTAPNTRSEKERKKIDEKWSKIKRRSMWWTTVAQSVGLYFPARRIVIIGYVIFVIGVGVCEFVFVGINLQRTFSCQGALI